MPELLIAFLSVRGTNDVKTVSIEVKEPLEKSFHVVTYEVAGNNGKERSTIIFHRAH